MQWFGWGLMTLALLSSAQVYAGCPAGYGMSWQGQCLDCRNTANALVCSGGSSRSGSSNGQQGVDVNQAAQIIDAVGVLGEMLDRQGEQNQAEEQQRQQALQEAYQRDAEYRARRESEERQRLSALQSANQTLHNAALESDDWKSRVQPAGDTSTRDCNCSKVVGACQAQITVTTQRATGVDYNVTSSEPYCAKVSYYIDNTPYLSILKNGATAFEHSASLKPVNASSFKVQRCDVCARQ